MLSTSRTDLCLCRSQEYAVLTSGHVTPLPIVRREKSPTVLRLWWQRPLSLHWTLVWERFIIIFTVNMFQCIMVVIHCSVVACFLCHGLSLWSFDYDKTEKSGTEKKKRRKVIRPNHTSSIFKIFIYMKLLPTPGNNTLIFLVSNIERPPPHEPRP